MVFDPILVAIVVAVVNLAAVYAAAFSFQLSSYAVFAVVVAMSLSIRLFNKVAFSLPSHDLRKILYSSAVALLNALLLLILLSVRFGFPRAFAVVGFNALLHGFLNYTSLF